MLCQLYGILQIPSAYMYINRNSACCPSDHSFCHKLTLFYSKIHHLTSCTTGINCLQSSLNAVLNQILKRFCIYLIILCQRSYHRDYNTTQFFHMLSIPFYITSEILTARFSATLFSTASARFSAIRPSLQPTTGSVSFRIACAKALTD